MYTLIKGHLETTLLLYNLQDSFEAIREGKFCFNFVGVAGLKLGSVACMDIVLSSGLQDGILGVCIVVCLSLVKCSGC